jgi:hypothetical protein
MEPLPITIGLLARAISWPDPNDQGDTLLSARTLGQVQALLNYMTNYIETQFERCRGKDNE